MSNDLAGLEGTPYEHYLDFLGGPSSLRELEVDTSLFYETNQSFDEDWGDTGYWYRDPTGRTQTCPSIIDLLPSSLHTLEKITIHMPARRVDFAGLKRLLQGVPLVDSGKQKKSDSQQRSDVEPPARAPRLRQLKVFFYFQSHTDQELTCRRHHHMINQARSYVLASFPGSEVEIVPYNENLQARWVAAENGSCQCFCARAAPVGQRAAEVVKISLNLREGFNSVQAPRRS